MRFAIFFLYSAFCQQITQSRSFRPSSFFTLTCGFTLLSTFLFVKTNLYENKYCLIVIWKRTIIHECLFLKLKNYLKCIISCLLHSKNWIVHSRMRFSLKRLILHISFYVRSLYRRPLEVVLWKVHSRMHKSVFHVKGINYFLKRLISNIVSTISK
jgi:hypothetical protein